MAKVAVPKVAVAKVDVAVSHCLLGCACRYDGGAKVCDAVIQWVADHAAEVEVVPVCPERASGLPVPRPPAERQGAVAWCLRAARM